MIWLERKVKLLLLSTVLILAILSGIVVMVYANGVANGTSTESGIMLNYGGCSGGGHGFGRRGFGWGGGSITVSQEYKDTVINIAKNDSDVQNLLADGYNITDVRPIINTIVEADGTVTMKATTAIVMLSQNTTGRAFVTVNVEEGKVTEIVILTRTVIEKP
ncbi:MAG: hypothetical protein OEY81_07855 [Candidatus Bathyarchaeota archaeon]|nr:hypothetical protein [Candidatus Bathyarchaeota archaeon]